MYRKYLTKYLLLYPFLLILLFSCNVNYLNATKKKEGELTVLQLNLWVECTKVPNAPQALIDQIVELKPDIATFCELYKGDRDDPILPLLLSALKKKKLNYYNARIDGRAVISRYPILQEERINAWQFKAVLDVKGNRVVVYPAHSEYRYYTSYYPRGYNDGSENWDKLKAPITDVDTILEVSRRSGRVDSAMDFINDAKKELQKGSFVIYAGDFNEPSHLDWQAETADFFDHNGCVVNWGVSSLLYSHGFIDAYRSLYPDVVNYPGFTFPANNKGVAPSSITWVPDVDERERIDFIYYYPNPKFCLKKATLIGPEGCIVRGEVNEDKTKDPIILSSKDHWPSDHKGVLVSFSIKK